MRKVTRTHPKPRTMPISRVFMLWMTYLTICYVSRSFLFSYSSWYANYVILITSISVTVATFNWPGLNFNPLNKGVLLLRMQLQRNYLTVSNIGSLWYNDIDLLCICKFMSMVAHRLCSVYRPKIFSILEFCVFGRSIL